MPAYSYSRIACFEQCPQKYKFSYIDRIRPEIKNTVEAFLGSCVHEALQKLYRDKMYEKELSLEDLLAFYNVQWEKDWEESILIVKKDYTQENYRKMGERYLADYYRRHAPFDSGRIIGLETKEFLPLDEEGTYQFHIRIDRLMDAGGGIYEVHDYKTGQSLPRQEDLEQDRQLAFYALWVKERFQDFREVRLVWHYVAYDKEMDMQRTKDNLESMNLKEEALEKIRAIELAEQFPPIVSTLCSWCGFQKNCPMWKHEKALEEKPANEYLNDPGVKLVDEYVRIKKELDDFSREASEKLEKLKDNVSEELNKLILVCMEKDRGRRYQTAAELLTDLQNIEEGIPLGERKLPARRKRLLKEKLKIRGKSVFLYGGVPLLLVLIIAGAIHLYTTRAATIDSIAVLPLENLTGDTEQEYFVDWITDELTGKLARVGTLRVISFRSMMRYKGSEKSLLNIVEIDFREGLDQKTP